MNIHFKSLMWSHDVVNRYGRSVSQMTKIRVTDDHGYVAFSVLVSVRSFPVHDL